MCLIQIVVACAVPQVRIVEEVMTLTADVMTLMMIQMIELRRP